MINTNISSAGSIPNRACTEKVLMFVISYWSASKPLTNMRIWAVSPKAFVVCLCNESYTHSSDQNLDFFGSQVSCSCTCKKDI